jgi:hypothetical protein
MSFPCFNLPSADTLMAIRAVGEAEEAVVVETFEVAR